MRTGTMKKWKIILCVLFIVAAILPIVDIVTNGTDVRRIYFQLNHLAIWIGAGLCIITLWIKNSSILSIITSTITMIMPCFYNLYNLSDRYGHQLEYMLRVILRGNLLLISLLLLLITCIINIIIQGLNIYKTSAPKRLQKEYTPRSQVVAGILSFFYGVTGAHRYYLGYKKQGIIQSAGLVCAIVGTTIYIIATSAHRWLWIEESIPCFILCGFGSYTTIWAFVDFIRILIGGLKPANGSKYAGKETIVQVVQSAPSASDNVDALEKLAKLHEQGILTDDEFNTTKANILAKM